MSQVIIRANGVLHLPGGDPDPFLWTVTAPTSEDAMLRLAELLCPFLNNRVPFAPIDGGVVAIVKLEVITCG